MTTKEEQCDKEVKFENARVTIVALIVDCGKLLVGRKVGSSIGALELPHTHDDNVRGESIVQMAVRAAKEGTGVMCSTSVAPVIFADQTFIFGQRDVGLFVVCHPIYPVEEEFEVNGVLWQWKAAEDAIPTDGWFLYRNLRTSIPDIGGILARVTCHAGAAVVLDIGLNAGAPNNVRLVAQN